MIAMTARTMPIAKPALVPAELCRPGLLAWAELDGPGADVDADEDRGRGGVKFPGEGFPPYGQ